MPKARVSKKTPELAPYDAAQAKKKIAAAAAKKKPAAAKKAKVHNPLFIKRTRKVSIGSGVPFKRDLTHFVKWPRYIQVQRQKRVLQARLKVPPVLEQFNQTVDKNTARRLFALADKYKPETKLQKKQRLAALAEAKLKDPKSEIPAPPPVLK
ncbi:MAG: hypothetical protein Q8P67_22130 [archaeon]|nr:hypothetical protein [archaeon]